MTAKLKRGRLWYIACKTPIPYPQNSQIVNGVSRQVNLNPGTPTLRPIRQPLYDNRTLEPIRRGTLFTNDTLGEYGYYRGEKGEIIWKANWDAATAFDTREDAESRAFEVVMEFPHLIGKLTVMKLKVRFGS